MSLEKTRYKTLCETRSLPIFMQYWWLDAVCGEAAWNVALSYDKGGNIRGALAYHTKRYFGVRVILPPQLTPYTGLWLDIDKDAKSHTRYALEHEITTEIIADLPRVPFLKLSTSFMFQDGLPFLWNGFRQTLKYTYVLENLQDTNFIFNQFKSELRREIRLGEQQYELKIIDNIDIFYDFNKKAFERKGLKIPYSLSFLQKLDTACVARNARKIYVAEQNNISVAMLYTVFDDHTTTNLMNAFDPEISRNVGVKYLLWCAIKDASVREHRFDFEGSMLPGIEAFVRGFGGEAKPYYSFSRSKNRFWKMINIALNYRY
jgi:hypothetical protein